MCRLLFTFVAGLSFVLAMGSGYLWWRSYRTCDIWQRTTADGRSRHVVSTPAACTSPRSSGGNRL